MAITAAMSADDGKDAHEHDLVMPGFRFHPTEEELIEFYLRRKVEGKRFNVELITFLDLYRYDPWELPALAAIGEKEWFFYVPRDRKYRNGDRPNRVTTSGYWKATGADRMIRAENHRSIGLKKTLVFYTGKAPKGVRTSWIMNEYRLPQSETDRHQKVEISLCRVYKRSGVDDHCQLPGTLSSKASSSKGTGPDKKHASSHQPPPSFETFAGDCSSSVMEKTPKMGGGSNTRMPAPVLQKPALYGSTASVASLSSTTSTEEDGTSFHYPKNTTALIPTCSVLTSATSSVVSPTIDELQSLIGYNVNQNYMNQPNPFLPSQLQPQLLPLNTLPVSFPTISDKLWEWNPLHEVGRDFTSFK